MHWGCWPRLTNSLQPLIRPQIMAYLSLFLQVLFSKLFIWIGLNLFHSFIILEGLLVVLKNVSSTLIDLIRISMPTVSLIVQVECWIVYLQNAFLWLMIYTAVIYNLLTALNFRLHLSPFFHLELPFLPFFSFFFFLIQLLVLNNQS